MDKKYYFDFKTSQEIIKRIGYIDSFKGKWQSIQREENKYLKELQTEVLAFGPCHTAKFWKEHIKKTELNEFEVIEKLIGLLDSDDPTTQAVACFDLGEFSRLHPFSKMILEKLDGKTKLMKMIEKDNSLVREHALVAIQKLMINNWQIIV